MAQQTHVLIDTADSFVNDCVVAEGGSGGRKWGIRSRTLHGGQAEGVQVVAIDNGAMTIDVLPTRGMGIWRVRRGNAGSPSPNPFPTRGGGQSGRIQSAGEQSGKKQSGGEQFNTTLGWRAPCGGPVHPGFVRLMEPGGLGWLDGFCELLCRCGLESNGPPEFDEAGRLVRPLHGRIANLPAHRVELGVDEAAGRLTLRGVVDEARFHFQALRLTTSISTKVGSNEFSWSDEVENIGGREATMQMLYHFNIGQPLLKPGARIVAPIATVAPKTEVAAHEGVETWNIMPAPRPGSDEQVYVCDLVADTAGDTRVLVSGLAGGEAVGLKFNKRALPCFTVWRNTPAEADGYVLGIEPGTNYPNPRSFEIEHGRAITLKPGERWSAAVTATWHQDARSIAEEERLIAAIQGYRQAEKLQKPRADWAK